MVAAISAMRSLLGTFALGCVCAVCDADPTGLKESGPRLRESRELGVESIPFAAVAGGDSTGAGERAPTCMCDTPLR